MLRKFKEHSGGPFIRSSFVIVFLVVGVWVGSLASAEPSFVPAQAGDSTYSISGVEIASTLSNPTGSDTTIVQFSTTWPQDGFPGYVICRAEIFNAAGDSLATKDFQYASFLSEATAREDLTSDSSVPAEATLRCSRGELASQSAGYSLSNPRVVLEDVGPPRLVFHAQWLTDEPPLYQQCNANFDLPGGDTRTYPFGISVGRDQDVEVLLTENLATGTPASVTCSPFTGTRGE